MKHDFYLRRQKTQKRVFCPSVTADFVNNNIIKNLELKDILQSLQVKLYQTQALQISRNKVFKTSQSERGWPSF